MASTNVVCSAVAMATIIFLWLPIIGARDEESNCPPRCICMMNQAYCDNIDLPRIPKHLPRNLQALHMRDNRVRKLKHGHLRGLNHLRHVILKGNRISYIEPTTFKDLTNLVSLSLTDNNIRYISKDVFSYLTQLRVFSLRGNKLTDAEHLFHNLVKLQLINLGNNRIKKITHRTFRFNWQLQIIDLHNNNIRSVHKNTFRTLPFLKFLVLRDNPLHHLELDFRLNFHLELLDFTNCRLKEVVKGMPFSIRDLRLAENYITKINEDDFKSTRKIRLLVLNNNQIEHIHDRALSNLWELYDVYLGKNQIRQLPANLPATTHAVYANFNNISRLSSRSFWRCSHLAYLYARHNKIHDIDQEAFYSMNKLRSLDMSYNDILDIKAHVFRNNREMQKLDISNNPIKALGHNCFAGLENLHIFQMSSVGSDEFSYIQPTIFKDMKKLLFLDLSNSTKVVRNMAGNPLALELIKSVQDLNLMEDGLYGLPSDFPNHFPELRLIKLVGNPWHCDKNIMWLAYWMRNHTVDFFAPYHMICMSPPHLYGYLIMELTDLDLPDPTPPPPTQDNSVIDLVEISFKHMTNKPQSSNGSQDVVDFTRIPPIDWTKKSAGKGPVSSERKISLSPSTQDGGYSKPPDYILRRTTKIGMAEKPATVQINTWEKGQNTQFELDYQRTTRPVPDNTLSDLQEEGLMQVVETYDSQQTENSSFRKVKVKKKQKYKSGSSSHQKGDQSHRHLTNTQHTQQKHLHKTKSANKDSSPRADSNRSRGSSGSADHSNSGFLSGDGVMGPGYGEH